MRRSSVVASQRPRSLGKSVVGETTVGPGTRVGGGRLRASAWGIAPRARRRPMANWPRHSPLTTWSSAACMARPNARTLFSKRPSPPCRRSASVRHALARSPRPHSSCSTLNTTAPARRPHDVAPCCSERSEAALPWGSPHFGRICPSSTRSSLGAHAIEGSRLLRSGAGRG